MSLTKEEKGGVIEEFRLSDKDTGSCEVQIALLTKKINHLSEHFKTHLNDNHSRYGFLKIIAARRKLLNYMMRKDTERYKVIIKKLNIRK